MRNGAAVTVLEHLLAAVPAWAGMVSTGTTDKGLGILLASRRDA